MISKHLTDNNLEIRQASAEDVETMVEFITRIHNKNLGVSARELMNGNHPTTDVNDFVIVIDHRSDGKIVAMGGLISQTWSYEGISFGVGNPEFITTDPDYRRRGLIHLVMERLHRLSKERGDLVQAIQGLRWFYRQFGYEYALSPGRARMLDIKKVAATSKGFSEKYQIKRATEKEIEFIEPLYQQQCFDNLITNKLTHAIRERDIQGYPVGSDLGDWTYVITGNSNQFIGYFSTWGDPWGSFTVKELNTKNEEDLEKVLPSILRNIQSGYLTFSTEFEDEKPAGIRFLLTENHPVYKIFGDQLGEPEAQFDWYIRIEDLPRFIILIKPALEERFANSISKTITHILRLNFYQGGIQIVFEEGQIRHVSDWTPKDEDEEFETTSFPPLVFLKLLFGYRSIEELVFAYPDCWINESDRLLLEILFPKKRSWLRMI